MKRHVIPSLLISSIIAIGAVACATDKKGSIIDDDSFSSSSSSSSSEGITSSESSSSSSSSSSSQEDLSGLTPYNPSLYVGGNGVTTLFEKNKTNAYYSLTNYIDPRIVDSYGGSPNNVYIPNTNYEKYIKNSFDVSQGQKVSISFTVPMFNPDGSFAFKSKNDEDNNDSGHFFVSLLNADNGQVLARVKMEFWRNQYILGNHKCFVSLGNSYPSSIGTQDEIVGGWIHGDATLNSSFYFAFDKKDFFQTKFGEDSVYEGSIDNSEGALREYFTNNINDIKRVKFEISGDGGWSNQAKIILNEINGVTLSSVKQGDTGYIKKDFQPNFYQDGNPTVRAAVGEKLYIPYFVSDLFGDTHELIRVNGTSRGDQHEYQINQLGDLRVTYEGYDDFNNEKYERSFNVQVFERLEINPTIEILGGDSLVYDGTVKYPAVVVKNGLNVLSDDEYTVEYMSTNINAGQHAVLVTSKNNNYSFEQQQVLFTIQKRPVTITWPDHDFIYTGSTQEIVPTGQKIDNTPLSLAVSTTPELFKEPGDYVATATITTARDRNNYQIINNTQNYTIERNIVPGVSIANYSGTYDGESHSILVTAPSGSTITYSETHDGEYTSVKPVYTDAGFRTIYVKVSKPGYETFEGQGTVSITGIQINVINWHADDYEYDGTVQTITASYTDADNHEIDLLVTTNPGEFRDEGTYIATATFNHAEVNYRLPANNTKQYTMHSRAIPSDQIEVTNYVGTFDGEPHTFNVTAPSGSVITYCETQSGEYTSVKPTYTAVGTRTVYIHIDLDGYSTASRTATVTINPLAITESNLKGFTSTYTYDGTTVFTPEVTLTVNTVHLVKDVDFELSGDTSATDIGDYTLTITGIGNYSGSFNKAWAINNEKQSFSTQVNIEGWTYGDTPNAPSVTNNPGSGEVSYTYKVRTADDSTYTSTVPTEAGEYTVKAYIPETDIALSATATANFTIARKEITPSLALGTTSYTYSGSAKTPSVTVTYNTQVLSSSEYNVSYSNNTNAGTATATVIGTKNYIFEVSQPFTINPANPVTSAPTLKSSLTYSQGEQSLVNQGTVANGTIQYSIDDGEYSSSLPNAILVGTYNVKYKVTGTNSNYNDVNPVDLGNITINRVADTEFINAWMFAGSSGISSKFESDGKGAYEDVNVVPPNDYNYSVKIPNDSRFNDAFDISNGQVVSIKFSMPMFTSTGAINYVSGNDYTDGGGGVHFYLNVFNADTSQIICRLKWVIWANQYNLKNHKVYLGVEGTNGSWPGDTDDYAIAESWVYGDALEDSYFYFSFDKTNYLQTLFSTSGYLGRVDTSGNRLKTYLDANIASITHIRFEITGDNGFKAVNTQPIVKVREINGQPIKASAVYDGNWEGKIIDNVGPNIYETGVIPTVGTTSSFINLPLAACDVVQSNVDWFVFVDGKYATDDLSFKIKTTGEHTVRAYAVDSLGNYSFKEYSITIS